MKIGIIVAMDKEFAQLKTLLTESQVERKNYKDFVIGKIGNNEVVMQQCGIGKVNSTIGAVEMIDNYHPDLVISSGVAGGADINLNVTEVVVATNCVYHDAYCGEECEFGQILGMPASFKTPKEYVEKALAINNLPGNRHPKIHAGQIVSGEWFVDSKEKMRSILEHFPQAMAAHEAAFVNIAVYSVESALTRILPHFEISTIAQYRYAFCILGNHQLVAV